MLKEEGSKGISSKGVSSKGVSSRQRHARERVTHIDSEMLLKLISQAFSLKVHGVEECSDFNLTAHSASFTMTDKWKVSSG